MRLDIVTLVGVVLLPNCDTLLDREEEVEACPPPGLPVGASGECVFPEMARPYCQMAEWLCEDHLFDGGCGRLCRMRPPIFGLPPDSPLHIDHVVRLLRAGELGQLEEADCSANPMGYFLERDEVGAMVLGLCDQACAALTSDFESTLYVTSCINE